MAKPMVVTLPFVLILLDYWPLNRFNSKFSVFKSVFEKIPFFVLSVVVCVITQVAQRSTWAVATSENLPLKARLLNVPIAYFSYIEKMFWPSGLTFFYPHRGIETSAGLSAVSLILLVILTIVVLYFWRTRKYPVMGWFWFLGTLVPVIGLVQVGRQAMADRYTYIPLTGIFIIVIWGICDLLESVLPAVSLPALSLSKGSNPFRKIILSLLAAAVLMPLSVLTWRQVGFWRDDITLYKRAVAVVPDNWWVYQLLGQAYAGQGKFQEAEDSYKESLRIMPGSLEVINELGNALLLQNKYDEIIALYKKILPELPDTGSDPLSIIPDNVTPPKPEGGKEAAIIRCYTQGHFYVGEAFSRLEKDDEAIKHYAEAIRIKPDFLEARKSLAKSLIMQGRADFAVEQLEKCLLINPDSIDLHATLATVLLSNKRSDESLLQANEILRLQPDSSLGFYMLARVYQQQGKLADAAEAFDRAAQLAEIAGQEDLAKQIQTEANALKTK
jgi:tetratricopeptide (TPR) repeat protein